MQWWSSCCFIRLILLLKVLSLLQLLLSQEVRLNSEVNPLGVKSILWAECDSACVNTPTWDLYNLVEGLWHYLEKLKLRSGCRAKRIWEETSGSKINGISSLHVYYLHSAQVNYCETCWVCPRTSLPLICLPVTQHKLGFIKYRGPESQLEGGLLL